MESGKRFYSPNMFRVCIDACKEDINGRAYSPILAGEIPFSGFGELLLKMDKLFDSIGYPQAFQDKRSFEKERSSTNTYRGIPKMVQDVSSILEQTGKCRTYDIAVVSRRNTSWQGILFDAGGMECGKFDGEVELLEKLTQLISKG